VGIALVAVAAAAMIGTAVFSSPSGFDVGTADGASVDASLSPTVAETTPTPSATPPPPTATPTRNVAAAKPPATTKPPTATKVSAEAAYEASVLSLVNQERAKAGCPALTADSRLAKAAKGHSADMAARNYFDHTTPDGVTFATRISNAGYRWSAAAENIAAGQKDPAAVMTSWMNSAGHRANILNCGYRNLGVGLAYNAKKTPYWTQDFGTPA
jgi:uncharacterized protein YkwD